MTHPDKYTSAPLMTAEKLLAIQCPESKRPSPPKTVLIIMKPAILEYARSKIWGKKTPYTPANVVMPRFSKNWKTGLGLLGNIGVGGVSVVANVELLAAWGVQQVVLIGVAGGLQPQLTYGDVVIPTQALRDEGVSIHYRPKEKWAVPSEKLNLDLIESIRPIRPIQSTCHTAPVWTTDAPFRETQAEVRDYSAEGMVAVEMECASLFTAAQSLGVSASAVLVISDSLATGEHRVAPNQQLIDQTLKQICDQLIKLFNK